MWTTWGCQCTVSVWLDVAIDLPALYGMRYGDAHGHSATGVIDLMLRLVPQAKREITELSFFVLSSFSNVIIIAFNNRSRPYWISSLTELLTDMEIRWNKLTQELVAPDIRSKWWTRICQTLGNTKQRKYYYNLEYLERRFNLYDSYIDRLSDGTAVALAMFFQQ